MRYDNRVDLRFTIFIETRESMATLLYNFAQVVKFEIMEFLSVGNFGSDLLSICLLIIAPMDSKDFNYELEKAPVKTWKLFSADKFD
jgi:hypothetical protein